MYNIGICDDGKNICAEIEKMILHFVHAHEIKTDINIWYKGEELRDYLQQKNHLDILFLDIELFELSGMDVGNFIRNHLEDREMQIIYISGKSSYAQDLFKTQPMDFLLKPIYQTQINEALELAIKIIDKDRKVFEFQRGKEYFYIPFGDIMYFVSDGRKIKVVMSHGEEEFYGKLKEIAKKLPKGFITIHQSYIVNNKYISHYTYEMVELTGETKLPISKINRKKVRELILQEG